LEGGDIDVVMVLDFGPCWTFTDIGGGGSVIEGLFVPVVGAREDGG